MGVCGWRQPQTHTHWPSTRVTVSVALQLGQPMSVLPPPLRTTSGIPGERGQGFVSPGIIARFPRVQVTARWAAAVGAWAKRAMVPELAGQFVVAAIQQQAATPAEAPLNHLR